MYHVVSFDNKDKIEVSKQFFDDSNLISQNFDTDISSFPLPTNHFDKNIITLLDNFLTIFSSNDTMMLTKLLSLMHFLDIKSNIELLFDKLISLLNNVTDDNFDNSIDKDFANNCNLVSILWNKTKEKKIFFKLSKFSYALLSLDLHADKSVTQEDLYTAPDNLIHQIIKLNASERKDITNVNMFVNLEELDASCYSCGIDQEGIQYLFSLRKLNMSGNYKINNLNHMTKLIELNASHVNRFRGGIKQEGIQQLTGLTKFDISHSHFITNVNHMTQLEELYARGSQIDQEGIQQLTTLRKLGAWGNNNIKDVNHMVQLEELDAGGDCNIDQNGVQKLTKLRKLKVDFNGKINDVNHMPQLEELNASGSGERCQCGINQDGIQNATAIRKLEISGNPKIKDVTHMTLLEELVTYRNQSVQCDTSKGLKIMSYDKPF